MPLAPFRNIIFQNLRKGFQLLLVFGGVLLVLMPTVWAQGGGLPQYGFNHYGPREGLRQNTIYSMVEGPNGFLWIGTQQGLSRFDGQEFVSYGREKIGGARAQKLAWGEGNVLWIATDKGITQFDLCTEESRLFSIEGAVRSLLPMGDSVWLGTSTGLWVLSGNQFVLERELDSLDIRSLLVTANGDLWALTRQGVWSHTAEGWTQVPLKAQLRLQQEPSLVSGVFQGDTLWLGDVSGRFFAVQGETVLFSAQMKSAINCIALDQENQVWVGTQSHGVQVLEDWSQREPQYKRLTLDRLNPRSLSDNQVLSLLQDRQGGMWVGTYAGGLHRYDTRKDIFWYEADPKFINSQENFYWTIEEDWRPEILWLGKKDGGVKRFNKETGRFRTILFHESETDEGRVYPETVYALYKDELNQLWAGTEKDGLYLLKNDPSFGFFAYEPTLKNGSQIKGVTAIQEIKGQKTLVLAERGGGVSYLDYASGKLTEDMLFSDTEVNCLLPDSYDPNVLWLGTEKEGVLRKNLSTNQVDTFLTQGYPVFVISQSEEDSSELWIGTQGNGLMKLDKQTHPQGSLTSHFDPEKRIDVIYSIIPDPNYPFHYWLTSVAGIAHYDANLGTYDIIDYQYGLKGVEFILGSSLLASDSLLYLGQGNNGLLVLDPRRFVTPGDTLPASMNLTGLWVKGKQIHLGMRKGSGKNDDTLTTALFCLDTLPVNYEERSVALKVQLPDFTWADQVRYKTTIVTPSSIWSRLWFKDGQDTLAFSQDLSDKVVSLPFRLQDVAFSSQAVYEISVLGYYYGKKHSTEVGKVVVIVNTPYYLQGWFLILMTLFGLLSLGAIAYSARARRRSRRLQELTQTVAENTKELRDKNQQLTEQAGLLAAQKDAFAVQKNEAVERNEHLDQLHYRINAISRLATIEEIGKQATRDMVEFFGYDYVSFSIVDHLGRTIEVKFNDKAPTSKVDPEEWQPTLKGTRRKLKLTDRDILSHVVIQEDVYLVDGNLINAGAKEDGWIEIYGILDEKLFEKYGHGDLVRAFVPMKHRARADGSDEKADYPIGVFEVGYHRSTGKKFERQNIIDLKLYIDNCAQPFYRASVREENTLVEQQLAEFDECENANQYLKRALDYLGRLIHADKGDFSFLPLDTTESWFPTEPIVFVNPRLGEYPSENPEEHFKAELLKVRAENQALPKPQKGIYRTAIEKKYTYTAENVLKDPNYIAGLKEIKSQISVPLISHGKAIGAISFYGKEVKLFDKRKAQILGKFADKLGPTYIKKKIDGETRGLVKPFNILSDEEIYQPICEAIERYFQTPRVMAWQYELGDSSENFIRKYPNQLGSNGPINALDKLSIQNLSTLKRTQTFIKKGVERVVPKFKRFMQQNRFSSLISIPILLEDKLIGLIVIFSTNDKNWLLPEDKIFLNLIAQKGAMDIQMARIIRSLETLSKSGVERQQDQFLRELVREAGSLLQADPVVLYPYQEGEEIRFRDGVYAGSFKDGIVKKYYKGEHENSGNSVYLANKIVQRGTVWLNSHKEYRTFVEKVGQTPVKHFSDDFFIREELQAMVGVQLKFEQRVMGVLFINYRTPQVFTPQTKRFIEAFAFLATNAIMTTRKLETVRQEREEQRAEATFFREAYFLRARGINHDIRNNLFELGMLKSEIEHAVYPSLSKRQRDRFNLQFENLALNATRIEELLEAFQITESQPGQIDVEAVINESIQFFLIKSVQRTDKKSEEKIIMISRENGNPFPNLFGDLRLFKMIIYNLLSNSVKAIEEVNESQFVGKITVRNLSTETELIMMVEDNGTGIDKKIGKRIFDPYFGIREEGVGFGLYFVQEVLKAYFNGSVDFESRFGHWTKFVVKIPLS